MLAIAVLVAQTLFFWVVTLALARSAARQEVLILKTLQTAQQTLVAIATKEEDIMATIKERLGALSADLDELEAEDKAAFERLEAKVQAGGALTPEEEAEFDDIEKRLVADALEAKGIVPDAPAPA